VTGDDTPIRDAATVVLLRDGETGIETLMLQRTSRAAFVPGGHVFPGGRVDAADTDPALYARCRGVEPDHASDALTLTHHGLAYWIAAVRECFEEAGVLLATDAAGNELPWQDPDWRARMAERRDALNAGELSFADFCAEHDLRLPVARLRYYGHWITPPGPPRRFSTRFFAARAPAGQRMRHDGRETVAGEWVDTADALRRYKRGEFPMIMPTVAQLKFLRAHDSVAEFLTTLDTMERVPTVGPDEVPGGARG